jgi:hypothetical protein
MTGRPNTITTAHINIEPYLAEYAKAKFAIHGSDGGIIIPCYSDLYHCIWEHMSIKKKNQMNVKGNLLIHLPSRRTADSYVGKNPAYYNYLSTTAASDIEKCLRLMFNFELHRLLLENEEFGHQSKNIDLIVEFRHTYSLDSISEDALLKNYYRYRNRIKSKKTRHYIKKVSV